MFLLNVREQFGDAIKHVVVDHEYYVLYIYFRLTELKDICCQVMD